MKPDPSRRRPSPPGALEAVVLAGRRRRARGLAALSLGVAALGVVAAVLVPTGDGDATERLAGPSATPTADPTPTEDPTPSATPTPTPTPTPTSTPAATPALVPTPSTTASDAPGAASPEVVPPTAATTTPPAPSVDPRCPARPVEGVPEPARGFDAAASLVPEEVPLEVLVCHYSAIDFPSTAGATLASRTVTGLQAVPESLFVAQRLPGETHVCDAVFRPPLDYLVRLDYGDGRSTWIHARNDCRGSATNGRFTASHDVYTPAARAFDTGRWPAQPAAADCTQDTLFGRAGQERELVPDGWRRVLLCGNQSRLIRQVDGADALAVVDRLNALPTQTSRPMGYCRDEDAVPVSSPERPGTLVFDYGPGRAVRVALDPGCATFAVNDSLEAVAGSAQQNAILDLVRG